MHRDIHRLTAIFPINFDQHLLLYPIFIVTVINITREGIILIFILKELQKCSIKLKLNTLFIFVFNNLNVFCLKH